MDDTDSFSFNREFKAKLMRLKINSIQAKETVRRHIVCLQLDTSPFSLLPAHRSMYTLRLLPVYSPVADLRKRRTKRHKKKSSRSGSTRLTLRLCAR